MTTRLNSFGQTRRVWYGCVWLCKEPPTVSHGGCAVPRPPQKTGGPGEGVPGLHVLAGVCCCLRPGFRPFRSARRAVLLICCAFPRRRVTWFRRLVSHPYVLLGDISVRVVGPFLNWVVCFLIVEF